MSWFSSFLFGAPAYAHEEGAHHSIHIPAWWEWTLEPEILIVLLLMVITYIQVFRHLKQGNPSLKFPTGPFALFFLGLFCLYAAIASPIDPIGEKYLFTVHMIQHNLFIYPVPILLLLGIPHWMLTPWLEQRGWKKIMKIVLHPLFVYLCFNISFMVWHVPVMYEWALQDRMVHNLEHLTFLVTAVMMWWPLLAPPQTWRLPYGLQMLYVLGLGIAQMPIFLFVTFADHVLYETYEFAEQIYFRSALEDQQVGGVLMQSVSAIVLTGALIWVFYRWYQAEQEKDQARVEQNTSQENNLTPAEGLPG